MFYLFGIHGKARSGKDTVVKYLTDNYGFIRNAFADPLKRAAQQMFMLTDAQTWDENLKEEVIPYWGMSPREIFQKIGTEGGREVFGDDVWLKRWYFHYNQFKDLTHYAVPDVRFPNEADYIRSLGGNMWHVLRDGAGLSNERAAHASEAGLVPDAKDIIIRNNGTLEDLYAQVDEVMQTRFHLLSVGG